MKTQTIIRYGLAAITVVILGALVGWYLFLRSQTSSTTALSTARGFGLQAPAGSPFGTAGTSSAPFGAPVGGANPAPTGEPPQLWQVATAPAGGVGFATSTQGTQVQFADRATGYIFDADPSTGVVTRLTNSLVPKVYEAYFASQGRVIERSVNDAGAVTTFADVINTASSSLSGISLPQNIAAVAPNPKTPQLLYLQPQGSGVAGITSGWDGSKQKQVFSSALSDWRLWWLGDGRIIIAQNASDSLPGYSYTVKNGALVPLLGPLPGLAILPRTGSSALLYSTSSGGVLSLFVQLSATTSATKLTIATVADKCVWAPGTAVVAYCAVPQTPTPAGFLDAWYRGELHTSDAIWQVDAGAGQAQLIFTPPSGSPVDVIDPVMDDGGAYIAFMNNVDESPWLLRLNK